MRGNALVAMSQVGTLRKRPDCTLQQMQLSADLTVIVPAYNEAACVADTIRSLRAQTAPPRKIIVVDDCSTDGTGGVARGHYDESTKAEQTSHARRLGDRIFLPVL